MLIYLINDPYLCENSFFERTKKNVMLVCKSKRLVCLKSSEILSVCLSMLCPFKMAVLGSLNRRYSCLRLSWSVPAGSHITPNLNQRNLNLDNKSVVHQKNIWTFSCSTLPYFKLSLQALFFSFDFSSLFLFVYLRLQHTVNDNNWLEFAHCVWISNVSSWLFKQFFRLAVHTLYVRWLSQLISTNWTRKIHPTLHSLTLAIPGSRRAHLLFFSPPALPLLTCGARVLRLLLGQFSQSHGPNRGALWSWKKKNYESRANMKFREITDFFLSVAVITKGYTVAGPSLNDYKLS